MAWACLRELFPPNLTESKNPIVKIVVCIPMAMITALATVNSMTNTASRWGERYCKDELMIAPHLFFGLQVKIEPAADSILVPE